MYLRPQKTNKKLDELISYTNQIIKEINLECSIMTKCTTFSNISHVSLHTRTSNLHKVVLNAKFPKPINSPNPTSNMLKNYTMTLFFPTILTITLLFP